MTFWVVRSGKHGEREALALEQDCILAGWQEFSSDLRSFSSTEDLRAALSAVYPGVQPRVIGIWAGELEAFRSAMTKGDLVALPRKGQPIVAVGEVVGSYDFDSSAPPGAQHRRQVRWLDAAVARSSLDQDLRYSMGSLLTVFRPRAPDAENRMRAALAKENRPDIAAPETSPSDAPIDLEVLGRDQVAELINRRFMGHELARLVEAILECDGFATRRSPPGADGGVDILAGKGALGLEGPRVAVQVKSGGAPTDAPTVRELQGVVARFGADYGLFVSWSGFTGPAEKEAQRDFFKMRLWSGKEVLDALLSRYDQMPEEFRAELPLKRIWTVATEDELDD